MVVIVFVKYLGRPRFLHEGLWYLAVGLTAYLLYSAFSPLRGAGGPFRLAFSPLPLYAALSLARMLAAYLLSLAFSIVYGYLAARDPRSEAVLLPLLDIAQSVPILGFFPAAVYFFVNAFRGSRFGVEAAAVFLIFTSQAWNMTFGVYESLTTVPSELKTAASAYRLEGFLKVRYLILPACVNRLVYNSMLSWAGGWYFLIAAEIIAVGPVNITLPGLGSFLIRAAESGDLPLLGAGLAVLVGLIWALDYAVWRPLAAWAERFKYEYSPGGGVAPSGFGGWKRGPVRALGKVMRSAFWRLAAAVFRLAEDAGGFARSAVSGDRTLGVAARTLFWAVVSVGAVRGILMLLGALKPPWPGEAYKIPAAMGASVLRLAAAYLISLVWTIPVAYLMGHNEKAHRALMPVFQVAASVPATALFPFIILVILRTTGSMDLASVILVLTGMQWYLLFNLVGAVRAVPADLKAAASAYGLRGMLYVRKVILPAIIPSLITGSITAWGGGWNALIVSEYVVYGGRTFEAFGIGSLLDRATYVTGSFPLIWLSLVAMVVVITVSNRVIWRPLYATAVHRYRID